MDNGSRMNGSNEQRRPLLSDVDEAEEEGGGGGLGEEQEQQPPPPPLSKIRSVLQGRWHTILAIGLLCLIIIFILVLLFVAPVLVQQYAVEAAVVDIQSVRLIQVAQEQQEGVMQVQASVMLDKERVRSGWARAFGVMAASVFRSVSTTGDAMVGIGVKGYGGSSNNLVSAVLPSPLLIKLQPGYRTQLDVQSIVRVEDADGIEDVVKAVLDGAVDKLDVVAQTQVGIRAGRFIPLGVRTFEQALLVRVPNAPLRYNVSDVQVKDDAHDGGVHASAVLRIMEPHSPLSFSVPELQWLALLQGCQPDQLIPVADITSEALSVESGRDIEAGIKAHVQTIDGALTQICEPSGKSPVDSLIAAAIAGEDVVLYARGTPMDTMPDWINDLLTKYTLPIVLPVPQVNTTDMLRDINVEDVKVSLPSPFAPPGQARNSVTVSGTVIAAVDVPDILRNVNANISSVKADIYLYDEHEQFGRLLVDEWVPANTTSSHHGKRRSIRARAEQIPVGITNSTVFKRVLRKAIGLDDSPDGTQVKVQLDGTCTADASFALGSFVIRDIPVSGEVSLEGLLLSASKQLAWDIFS